MNFAKQCTRALLQSHKVLIASARTIVMNPNIGIVGSPFSKGQDKGGVEQGPQALRDAGLMDVIKSSSRCIQIEDFGDVEYEPKQVEVENMLNYGDVVGFNEELYKKVLRILCEKRMVINLGGDHSATIGSLAAHLHATRGNVSVLWVDAHSDINTNTTSDTGNVHGMPLAMLLEDTQCYFTERPLPETDFVKVLLRSQNLAYIGLRSVDDYERFLIDNLGITAFSAQDVEKIGIAGVTDLALQKIDPAGNRSIHVSFDIDALEPIHAPSTGTPVRGGLTVREGVLIMETIQKTGRLNVFDLMEVNPAIGSEADVRNTIDAAFKIIQAACGHETRGNVGVTEMPK